MKEKIYIFDKYDNLLAITDNYIKADFEETVEMPVSFLINFPASDSDAEYLVGGNQVAFRDLKGDFRLFTIREVDDRDGEATEKIVNCMPGIQELDDVMVEERRPQDKTAEYVLGLILENARWQVGNVADFGINSTSFYFKNAYECLGELTDIWGGEIVDRVEIKGNKIAGRYVDIVHRKGSDTGKRFEIDKDIKNITRTVLYYPKTALYGKGKSLQTENEGHTRKITFRDVVWSKKKGDPVDKPKGQEWVGDPEALESQGIPNHQTGKMMHRFGLFEDSEEEDPEKLLAKTWQAVQGEKDPKAQYEMDIITFYGIAGYEHEQVFLGDTGIARDKDIKPMILIEARIMSWKYDIGNPEDGSLVLGNILDLDPDDSDIDWVIDKVKDKEGNWDAGGGPITDDKFPDVKPNVPQNVKAEGLFKKIMLSWEFESTYAIAAYEVFASQTNGFAPDPTNLVFRGKVGGYNFDADTDEKWYFRVRAVNTHGTASEYSEQVSASTVQLDLPDIEDIVPDFIEYSIYKGNEAPNPKDYKYWLDNSKEPNILRHWNGEAWKPLAPTSADELGAVAMEDYQEKVSQIVSDLADKVNAEWVDGKLVKKADKEIVDEVKADLAEKVNAEWVNGQLVSKANKADVYTIEQVDTRFNNVVSKTTYETEKDGIVKDLQSHETMIKQNAKEIASKASATEYNALKKRVNTAETSITQNAKEIKSKAEAETVNVLTGRVNKAESSITQNAKEIASKVSSNQYKTDKEGIIRDLESHESLIKQNAKSISSKVDATYVDSAIDGIEVGARNLINGSNEKLKTFNMPDWYDPITNPQDLADLDLKPGDEITLSFFARVPSNAPNTVWPRFTCFREDGSYRTFGAGTKISPGKEGYTSHTITIPSDCVRIEFAVQRGGAGEGVEHFTYYRKHEIAVKGNKATDWTPAPEDTQAQINDQATIIKRHTSEIEQNAKEIASRVSSGEYKVDKEGIIKDINNNKSSIEQQADMIRSKVDATYVKGELGKIKIGGRNLLKGTSNDFVKYDRTSTWGDYAPYNDVHGVAGEVYTARIYLKPHEDNIKNNELRVRLYGDEVHWTDRVGNKILAGEEGYSSVTFTLPRGYNRIKLFAVRFDSKESARSIVEYKEAKLEKGNKATDWTPAPEDFEAKIDDINVGGRNLIKDSKKREIKPRNTGESSDNYNFTDFWLTDERTTQKNQEYTFSARVEKTHGDFNKVSILEYRPGGLPTIGIPIDGNGYIQTTFEAGGGRSAIIVYAGLAGETRGNGMIIHEAKLEKGNKATDWTPAPEDTDKKIESVEHYASEIEQTAKGVEQKFSAIKTDYEKFKSTANSTFKQQADLIEGKVTETTYNKDKDNMTMRVSTAESSIKQNADEIVSKVSKNGVVSSINQSPEQIKINAQRVSIDGDLVVRNGKVYIKDGVITNDLIASNAKIDFAKIANVRVTNAMISSVTADKIKSGTIDAGKVLIRVKNGTQAIQIDDKGFESVDSRGRVRIHIGVRDIAGKGQSDPSTIRFYGGSGSKSAGVGMNVNDTFIVGSGADGVGMELRTHYKMNTIYYAKQHRFVCKAERYNRYQSKYFRFLGRTSYSASGGDENPVLEPSHSGWGYVGTPNYRLWHVYTNYIYAVYTKGKAFVNRSSIKDKKEVRDVSNDDMQKIFDQINFKSYKYKKEFEDNEDHKPRMMGIAPILNEEPKPREACDDRRRIGCIAEESPPEILDEDGTGVDLYDYATVIGGSLKHQTSRIDSLASEIESLKQEIKQLKGES
ncbi:hypothetical protein CAI16_05465 [Virgibacillus dokdonensis]|uniref:Peptidase S74 domain-containing protein n=1 Tax=Virgibacillus dokdonensis TaxID=302167 RepID=A0A3E0WWD3_9BACI|nr:phage tail spike protein [Virgibacillus dokdonensis]RFA36237.1 hypothetical protein CAI16_05465 [Virgibacillus dokdonensis]